MTQKIKIPKTLPTPQQAMEILVPWLDEPQRRLAGLSPRQLLASGDALQTWFVGSSVWYPAVMKKPPPQTSDIDIVLGYKGKADLVNTIIAKMNERDLESTYAIVGKNVHGGLKISRQLVTPLTKQDGGIATLIDVWELPKGVSICEHVMSYKYDHEHVALAALASAGEVFSLTRIVRPIAYATTPTGREEARQQRLRAAQRVKKQAERERERYSNYSDGS